MSETHLGVKEIVEHYGVSRATVLRWKRLGKFQEEDITELLVGKGTIKYLYSVKAVERIINESKKVRGTAPGGLGSDKEYTESSGYLLAIDLLKERVEELKEENAQLKEEVKLLRYQEPQSDQESAKEPQPSATPKEPEKSPELVNKQPNKSFDWGWFTVFAVGILLLAFIYYIETAY